jgi:hypothetical protein
VADLTAANFTVEAKLVEPDGSTVKIQEPDGVGGGDDGFYYVDLVSTSFQGTQYTRVTGRYVFSVAVTHGGDHGQTVLAVLVD